MRAVFLPLLCLFPLFSLLSSESYTEEELALLEKLTIITTTSPIISHPSTALLEASQESLFVVPAWRLCKKIIVFDGVPPQQRYRALAYELYIQNVQRLIEEDPNFNRTTLVVNREFKHLANSLKEAIKLVDTPYLFIHQHDFAFTKPFDLFNLLRSMEQNPSLKMIRFNHFANTPNWWDGPIDEQIEGGSLIPLMRTFGWSDYEHFARTDYYTDFVFPKVTWAGAMEWFLHDPEKIMADHASYGCYLYGKRGEASYLRHLDGKSFLLAQPINLQRGQ